jgi:hypothetical protein
VNYSASASDLVDGSVAVTCAPASGSTFALGTTTVHCSASDAHGNTGTGSFDVTVQDTTPPSLTVPADIIKEATSAAGAAVSFTTSATDAVDSTPTISCSDGSNTVHSGDTFPLGTTTVTCTASDDAGNTSAPKSFKITVQDTTPPSLSVSDDIIKEATSAAGAAVSFVTGASDAVDSTPTISCSDGSNTVNSGDTFPLGTTTVTCTASDDAGNTSAPKSFKITVQDTTPPTLTLPSDITALATSASGAVVTYSATASDIVDGAVSVNCSPASGTTFAVAATTVNCSATDAHGNQRSGSFKITVTYGVDAVRFLQPINWTAHSTSTNPDVSTFKAGSTVPVKVQVVLANGTIVQPASAQWISPQKGAATSQPIDETVFSDPASSGSNYVWNATGQFYQYNWGTAKNGAGFYWLIGVKLDDGQVYKQYISLR